MTYTRRNKYLNMEHPLVGKHISFKYDDWYHGDMEQFGVIVAYINLSDGPELRVRTVDGCTRTTCHRIVYLEEITGIEE